MTEEKLIDMLWEKSGDAFNGDGYPSITRMFFADVIREANAVQRQGCADALIEALFMALSADREPWTRDEIQDMWKEEIKAILNAEPLEEI